MGSDEIENIVLSSSLTSPELVWCVDTDTQVNSQQMSTVGCENCHWSDWCVNRGNITMWRQAGRKQQICAVAEKIEDIWWTKGCFDPSNIENETDLCWMGQNLMIHSMLRPSYMIQMRLDNVQLVCSINCLEVSCKLWIMHFCCDHKQNPTL